MIKRRVVIDGTPHMVLVVYNSMLWCRACGKVWVLR